MSGGRKLTDGELKKLEQEMIGGYENLQTAVRKLHQMLDTMQGQWMGAAAGKFDSKQREINMRINNINGTLNKYLDAAQMMRSDKDDLEMALDAELGKVDPEVGATKSAFSSYS
ncbi:WXG100 family type VII secretion target [Streptomyces indicus]|uniref:WXG100 family type VII secretion target n=1 Tax=Streptomyces indicus TaxID=417292 RepID=A0A1G8VT60_9ACTN|nr:WXG100 family type VII secretion target [Streptomyces indicus]SDJ69234.1 WXG100 family type VII secretion target [Streptomyces indicus]